MRPTLRCLNALHRAPSSRAQTLGFIGLGRMGSEMAFNLFSKTLAASPDSRFVVADALPAAAASFAASFAAQFPRAPRVEVAPAPADVIRAAGTVVTMLPSSPHVRAVYQGEGGLRAGLAEVVSGTEERTLCIDGTTLDVEVAREVAGDMISAGADMIDAPVSGGVTGAKAGTLSFLCGGPESAVQRAIPLLDRMGARTIHCGPSGAGLAAKIMNNLILGVHQIVVAEAMLLGAQKLGLEPAVLARVIGTSTGACWAAGTNNPVRGALLPDQAQPPCERGYDGGFATGLMLKDMKLATALAEKFGAPLPLGRRAEEVYEEAVRAQPELAGKDFSSVYTFLAQQAVAAAAAAETEQ